ncbi:unnamed protein product [Boreogadus saida]
MSAPEGAAGHRNQRPSLRGHASTDPGYGKMCHVCGRQNHLNNTRMGGRSPRPQPEETDGVCDEQQSAAFVELCNLTMTSNASDSAEDLIPVSMNMKAANDEGIRILWAAVVRFAGNSNDTRTLDTRQIGNPYSEQIQYMPPPAPADDVRPTTPSHT